MAHGEVRLREREGALGILALVEEEPPGVLGLGLGVKSNGQDFPLHPIRLRYHGMASCTPNSSCRGLQET